jgi:NAD(P)-dependent dehydrogenase (short-subunit alcohol dehydrogenase family)
LALVDKTVARFGRLDVAVNNAGTDGQVAPITDQTAESYAATFDTNVLGVILSMSTRCRLCEDKAATALSISPRPTGRRSEAPSGAGSTTCSMVRTAMIS